MSEQFPDNAALAKLEALAHEFSSAPVSAESHTRGHSRIMAAAHARGFPQRRRPRFSMWVVPVMAAATALLGVVWFAMRPQPLTYQVIGGSRFESGYMSARPDQPATVRFSDSSQLEANAGTKIRIDSTRQDGAKVLIERGRVNAQIHHGKASSWRFVAGPFDVEVVGTRFRLSWDPAKEEFDLALDEGAVRVHSPLGQGPFLVQKGQRFYASLLTHSVRMDDAGGGVPSAASVPSALPATASTASTLPSTAPELAHEVAPTAVAPTAVAPTVSGPTTSNRAEGTRRDSWPAMVSRGRFKSVIEEATDRGLDSCLSSCKLSDLRALADAARYANQGDLAKRSLMAIRQRAPVGAQRASAGFLLGRLSESIGQLGAANSWYETCLAESPKGEFAADALAGRMRVTVQIQGIAAARPVAQQYLLLYPNGVHRDRARQISESK